MIGQPITLLIPEDRLPEEPAVLSRIRQGESIEHYETVRRRKDGSLINISLSVSPILDADGQVVGASKIARDITERIQIETSLREDSQRKDEFLATLAHELRNPLAPLATGIELLRASPEQSSLPPGIVEVMDRQVRLLARLVDDLLEVSRVTRGVIQLRKELLSLDAAVQGAVEIAKPAIEAGGQRLEIAISPGQMLVHGDRTRLTQIIANLLNNAAKFTPPGGLIRVSLERDGADAIVRVADSGVGIPREKLDAIFEMFTQVHGAATGGLGIGLALAQRLAKLHGGSIGAHSAGADKGSEFVVRVPLSVATQPAVEKKQEAALPRSPPRRVLVVDDNADAGQNLGLLLRMLGHEVHVAENGMAGLSLADSLRPDVILLDIGMPDISGYEVAKQLRSRQWGKGVLLVALTGWGQESDRLRAVESGFDHHLTKPVESTTLEKLFAEQALRLH